MHNKLGTSLIQFLSNRGKYVDTPLQSALSYSPTAVVIKTK